MISLEDQINQAALRGNEEELKRVLIDYQILHLKWRGISKTPQGETLDLFGKSSTLSEGNNPLTRNKSLVLSDPGDSFRGKK
jgi:hypothetical protein